MDIPERNGLKIGEITSIGSSDDHKYVLVAYWDGRDIVRKEIPVHLALGAFDLKEACRHAMRVLPVNGSGEGVREVIRAALKKSEGKHE